MAFNEQYVAKVVFNSYDHSFLSHHSGSKLVLKAFGCTSRKCHFAYLEKMRCTSMAMAMAIDCMAQRLIRDSVQENSYMLKPMWLYLLLVFMVFVNFIFWDRWRHALKCQCVQCKVGIYLVNSFDSMWWRCVCMLRELFVFCWIWFAPHPLSHTPNPEPCRSIEW